MIVPVLSEQMHETQPNVSMDCKFRINTLFLYNNLFADKVNAKVTVGNNPSGMLLTIIPMAAYLMYT